MIRRLRGLLHRPGPAGTPATVTQSIYLDHVLMQEITEAAVRLQSSRLCPLIRAAWSAARGELARLRSAEELEVILAREGRLGSLEVGGWTKGKHRLEVTAAERRDMVELAGRLDVSISKLVWAAWILGRDRIETSPGA